MNTVLTLALAVSGGLINILLVLCLLAAAVLIILAVYLIRRSHGAMNKQAYEQQAALHLFLGAPGQGAGMLKSGENEQEQRQSVAVGQSKQCPFCGTDVFPGGIFCLHCGQRLPVSAQIPRGTPSASLAPLATPQIEQSREPGSISTSRPPVPSSQEVDDARVRAIEEQPTLIGDVVVTAVPEKREEAPAIEEWPTLIETAVVPVEARTRQSKAREVNIAEQPGYLILRRLSGKEVSEYALNKPTISIGRATNNDIVVPRDKLTSRHHATVRYEHGHYALYDERSANGTFLNGDEIEAGVPYAFKDGDTVGIGAYEFIYHASETFIKEIEHQPTVTIGAATNSGALEHAPSDRSVTERLRAEEEVHETPAESRIREEKEAETAPEVEIAAPAEPVATEAVAENIVAPVAAPETLLEHLRFTAFHPKEVAVDSWNTLIIYTYIEAAIEDIYRDVALLQREWESGVRKLSGGGKPLLPHATNITIVPECRGVLFNPKRVTLQWSDDWHRSIFRFYARRELAGLSRNGRINIFAGPLLVGTLRMAMLFEEQERLDPIDAGDADISTRPYERIFVSYSQQDKIVIRACQDMYRTLGFDELIKIDQMRDSQILQEGVKEGIEQAEIFQLFWSEHAAKSESVAREWEYALQLKRGEGFLRPVYWEIPLVSPPDTLGPFYFSYLPAYAFSSSSS
jgi:pSer/pThr/pTyr-binding forkhead associated (FHA) protein